MELQNVQNYMSQEEKYRAVSLQRLGVSDWLFGFCSKFRENIKEHGLKQHRFIKYKLPLNP